MSADEFGASIQGVQAQVPLWRLDIGRAMFAGHIRVGTVFISSEVIIAVGLGPH